MLIIFLIFSYPLIDVASKWSEILFSNLERSSGFKVLFISVDLPEPETPVTQVKRFNGICVLNDLRLFLQALLILIACDLLATILFLGTFMVFLPFR